MKPTAFEEASDIIHYEEPKSNLQILNTGEDIITVWHMTWRERIWLFFTGKIYVAQKSKIYIPTFMSTLKEELTPSKKSS